MDQPLISSTHNRLVSHARRLLAKPKECRKEGLLVAEGVHLVQEALRARLACSLLLAAVDPHNREIEEIVSEAEGRHLPVYRVLDHIFRSFSAVEEPQGVVGIFERPAQERSRIWGEAGGPRRHLAVAHGLQDPGNIGAILRAALAAGLRGVITTRGTVDPFHHRALRASMGAAFRLPIHTEEPLASVLNRVRLAGYRTAALSVRGECPLTEVDPAIPTAFFLGAEGSGLDPALETGASLRIRIPMDPGVESLGVAAAAAVTFFWLRLAPGSQSSPRVVRAARPRASTP